MTKKKKKSSVAAAVSTPARVRHEHSAGFLLFRRDHTKSGEPVRRWLLLDYGKHWDYPKGHLEKGETQWQAAVRELREETGIRQVDRRTTYRRQMHYAFKSPKKGAIAKTVTYFIGETRASKVTLSDEHTEYAWLTYEEAVETLTFANARELLEVAEETLRKET